MAGEFETPENFCLGCGIPLAVGGDSAEILECIHEGCPAKFCSVCRNNAEPRLDTLPKSGRNKGYCVCQECHWPLCGVCGELHKCGPSSEWMYRDDDDEDDD